MYFNFRPAILWLKNNPSRATHSIITHIKAKGRKQVIKEQSPNKLLQRFVCIATGRGPIPFGLVETRWQSTGDSIGQRSRGTDAREGLETEQRLDQKQKQNQRQRSKGACPVKSPGSCRLSNSKVKYKLWQGYAFVLPRQETKAKGIRRREIQMKTGNGRIVTEVANALTLIYCLMYNLYLFFTLIQST